MKSYRIPAHTQRFEQIIKKSRFITSVAHCSDKASAKAFWAMLREEFPDARHHCWAMMTGAPWDAHQWDQSDDGEPKGTAGKPMLNVLQHNDIGELMVVVTRYFGGIKLGAGGLVRAYSSSTQQAIAELETSLKVPTQQYTLTFDYSILGSVEYLLQQYEHMRILHQDFAVGVVMQVELPLTHEVEIKAKLSSLSDNKLVMTTQP